MTPAPTSRALPAATAVSPGLADTPARRSSAVIATAVAIVVCIALNVVEISRNGVDAANWGLLADLSEAVVPTLAAFLLGRRAIVTGNQGWWWLSAGALSWALGQIVWMILDFGYNVDPTVSVATIGFVGWSLLTAVGLLKIGGQNTGFTSARPIVAEALVITSCTGFLIWELALASQTTGQTDFEMAMLAIVPISTALVGSIALLLLLNGRSPAIGMFGLASVVLIVADSLLTVWFSDNAPLYATAHGLYLLTFALIVTASFLPHLRGRRAARSTLARLVIVYTPMVAAIWVATWHYFIQHRSASVVSVVIAFSMGVFVAGGQFTAWAESGRLADRLQSNVERLSDAEMHVRHLLDDLPVAVVLLSADGVVVDVNAVTLMLTGRSRDDVIGRPFTALLRPEDEPLMVETWTRLVRGEVLPSPVFAVPNIDGTSVMVEADVRAPLPRSDRVVVLLRDMTARIKRARELEDAQQRFQIAFRAAPTGMLMSSPQDFTLLDVNDALAEMLGSTRAELIGKSLRDITHVDDWAAMVKGFESGSRGGPNHFTMDKRFLRADGQVVWTQTSVSSMSDEHGHELAIAHIQDITDQRRTAAHLQWAASHDELTGLPNRNHFLDQLRRRLDGAELGSIAVLFIDLDNFKVVNDSLGHAVGDELLRGMSERLRSVVRDRDMLGRFGGDEFIVMLDGLQLDVSPGDVAERLRRAISQMLIVEDAELYVTGSIGIAYADRPGVTADELLRDADAAMYRAKARGRDCVEVFAPGAHETSVLALRTSSELRHGLERGEIVPYFQPIVDLPTGQLMGFEVLARWRHPDRGLLGPDQFLPMAEETGLIGEVGAAVLKASLTQLGRWQTSVPSLADVSISVNVSVRQLVDSRFNQLVAEALAESGVRAESLWLEITESALMSDVKAATVALRNLRSLGLHLSVDDFGTGYSSLTYLKRFPVEAIKVDRQFVKGLGIDVEDTTIVEAVINLGKSLGLMVVAEGVETPLQLSRLRETGCDRAQGYLFGRPRPAALIEAERASV